MVDMKKLLKMIFGNRTQLTSRIEIEISFFRTMNQIFNVVLFLRIPLEGVNSIPGSFCSIEIKIQFICKIF